MILSEIANYVDESIRSTDITLEEYITIDCLLQNKEGRTIATNLPPSPCSLTKYKPGDILIGNIRPYLKKIWKANCEGGCSNDVLVFRAKDSNLSDYLYALLLQDNFYSYVMKAPKGSKMPRGDKNHIMRFPVADIGSNGINVGEFISDIERKMTNNRKQNDLLEKLAKQLYDYWFVQFDFPDENGRPYKSSGGAMVYDDQLKREIPKGWECKKLLEVSEIVNGATPSTSDPDNYGGDIMWITPKDLSDQGQKFVFHGARPITQKGYDSCSTSMLPVGTVLMSSRAPIGLFAIAQTEVCTNQGFKSFVPKEETDGMYLYYYLKLHIKQIEQLGTGTTFKEVSRDDLKGLPILYVSDRALYSKWVEEVKPLFELQANLQQENERLQEQRNMLLPLLMTGQATLK